MLQYCSGEYKPKVPCEYKHIMLRNYKQIALCDCKHIMLYSDKTL